MPRADDKLARVLFVSEGVRMKPDSLVPEIGVIYATFTTAGAARYCWRN